MPNMPLTIQDSFYLVFYLDLLFCICVGWSKLVFNNTILCKPMLNNDYMYMNQRFLLYLSCKISEKEGNLREIWRTADKLSARGLKPQKSHR